MNEQDQGGTAWEAYAELINERYNVQNTPHVLWKGTRYASGMKRKLIN